MMRAGRDEVTRAAERAARTSYGKLVAILAGRDRDIAAAEDALSEALVAALAVWPERGVPGNPDAWLLTAARNRLKNRRRSGEVHDRAAPEIVARLEAAEGLPEIPDRRLSLMFVCAHPAIEAGIRTPLMLQTVLGLDAARIAEAFLIPAATMSQRLVRAKARIRDSGLRFSVPDRDELPERLGAVLDAVYAAFGRGWDLWDEPAAAAALSGEAIWLARLLVALLPEEPEPKGLLALMLYCNARRAARRGPDGAFVPLDRQDARLWDRTMIIEAEGLLATAARAGQYGRYQCEAAIQSVHVQRPITRRLDRTALRTLYDLLVARSDSIGARIGRAVVIAEAGEPVKGLAALDEIDSSKATSHQPYWVARGRIASLAGLADEAAAARARALALTADPILRNHIDASLGTGALDHEGD